MKYNQLFLKYHHVIKKKKIYMGTLRVKNKKGKCEKFKIRNKVKIVTPDHKNGHKGHFFLHLDLNII